MDDEYRATLQQLVARAQQNVLPKLVVMNGRRISAAERVLLPKKKVTHWGGTARNGGGKGRWPLKTTPLGDVHYLQNGKQHNSAEAAAAVMPVMPGQKFIQVPVIRCECQPAQFKHLNIANLTPFFLHSFLSPPLSPSPSPSPSPPPPSSSSQSMSTASRNDSG